MKSSKSVDYAIESEIQALKKLQKTGVVGHFCKFYGSDRKRGIPRVFMSHVRGLTLLDAIERTDNPTKMLGCVNQTLAAIAIMNANGMVHNDLHINNVMITKTKADVVSYDFGKGKKIEIATNGYSPVIIDFGFASVKDGRMYSAMYATDRGYYPFDCEDKTNDPNVPL